MDQLLIVGAGLCGSVLARSLSEQHFPHEVFLLEKSRGVGGRLAHRRMDLAGRTFGFNHGCGEFLEANHPAWPKNWTSLWQGLIDPQGKLVAPATEICKSLLKNQQVHRNVQAHNLKAESAKSLNDQDGKRWDFDHLVVTSPAPQAQQLLSAFLTEREKELLAAVTFEKILICFYQQDREIKMLKATPEWSDIHFEASTEEIKKAFHREFLKDLSLDSLLEIKKWRFSQTHRPLEQNYMRLEKYPWMWIAGDSFAAAAGSGILRALHSGLATAQAISETA